MELFQLKNFERARVYDVTDGKKGIANLYFSNVGCNDV